MELKPTRTERGFGLIEFIDRNGVTCSLQESSIADSDTPGASCVWLGCSGPNPKTLVRGQGWVDVTMPDAVQCTTRMHLSVEQVEALIVALQRWVDTGTLAEAEGED